jgi:putative nucleotidyltransferase with HDIG domain
MRREIREGEIAKARRAVPAMILLELNDRQADATQALVNGLIAANTFYNEEETEKARDAAAQNVKPINRTIAAGETILREGDIVTDLDIEALGTLGLLQPHRTWRDYLSALIFTLIVVGMLATFITYRRRFFWHTTSSVLLMGSIFSVFVLLARMLLPMHTLLPYLFPLASMAMLIGSLIDLPMAMLASALVSMLIGRYLGGDIDVMIYLFLGGIAGALALGKAERLNSFVRAGLWTISINLLVILVFRLPQLGALDNQGMLELAFAGLINGIFASSFTLVVYYLLGQLFGVTSSLQLLEISRPNHPLLRQLLLKAPGTYHHTLIVSNMAEEAAVAIGADSLLARVGSYYHDIGKIIRPYFFIENNADSENPHDRIDPYTSARIIISHVTDGVELAEKHHLPPSIIDFIREHHGTTRVEYFYHKAVQMEKNPAEVEEGAFRYAGPKPHTRETAILMLADTCEAMVRAVRPQTSEELLELIRSAISRRLMSGQLDDSPLTLQDLTLLSEAFARVLQGIHHPRVQYPGEKS